MKPFADHFSRISSTYAAYRPRYPAWLFERLARAVRHRRLAWDCATGTGQAAAGLARWFDRVVASDASRHQVRRGDPHRRVWYVAALAEAGPVRPRTADLVTVAQALHWLDLDRFYGEVRRALVPGGLVVAWTYGRHHIDDGPVDAVVEHFYRDVVGPYWPPERRWVEEGYAGLPFPFQEERIEGPDMEEQWTLTDLLGYIGTWSAVVRCREATGADPLHALGEALRPIWGDEASRRQIHWELSVRAGRT